MHPSFLRLSGIRLGAAPAIAVLAVGGVAAAAASGGVSDAAGNAADVLAALHVTDRTPVQADAHIDAIDSSQGEAPQAGSNEHANDNASHPADNAGDGIGNSNASDTGLEHANDNAFDGAGNANDKSDNGNADHDVDLPDAAEEHEGAGSSHAPENVPDQVELPFD